MTTPTSPTSPRPKVRLEGHQEGIAGTRRTATSFCAISRLHAPTVLRRRIELLCSLRVRGGLAPGLPGLAVLKRAAARDNYQSQQNENRSGSFGRLCLHNMDSFAINHPLFTQGARLRCPTHPGNTPPSCCVQQGEYRWVMHDPFRHRLTIRAGPSLALCFAFRTKARHKCQIDDATREEQTTDEA